MSVMQIASQLLSQKMGSDVSEGQAENALQGLMGGDFNIGELVSKFSQGGGLASQLQSWLGDGANEGISASSILDIFGGDKVQQFASQLGVSDEEAAGGLADMIPQLIDKSSSGGNLLESIGGVSGALNMAKSFFK